jgi:hypothetical protein
LYHTFVNIGLETLTVGFKLQTKANFVRSFASLGQFSIPLKAVDNPAEASRLRERHSGSNSTNMKTIKDRMLLLKGLQIRPGVSV